MDLKSILHLTESLVSLTNENTIGEISNKFSIDKDKVSSVLGESIPTIIGAMQKNAATKEGAASLAKALGDHADDHNSVIGNLKNVDLADGTKILGKVFGGNLESMLSEVSKNTGVGSLQVKNILSAIAPAMLNILGGLRKKNNTSDSDLGGLLGSLLGGGSTTGGGSVLGGMLGSIFGK